jgi:hypothetical protein
LTRSRTEITRSFLAAGGGEAEPPTTDGRPPKSAGDATEGGAGSPTGGLFGPGVTPEEPGSAPAAGPAGFPGMPPAGTGTILGMIGG